MENIEQVVAFNILLPFAIDVILGGQRINIKTDKYVATLYTGTIGDLNYPAFSVKCPGFEFDSFNAQVIDAQGRVRSYHQDGDKWSIPELHLIKAIASDFPEFIYKSNDKYEVKFWYGNFYYERDIYGKRSFGYIDNGVRHGIWIDKNVIGRYHYGIKQGAHVGLGPEYEYVSSLEQYNNDGQLFKQYKWCKYPKTAIKSIKTYGNDGKLETSVKYDHIIKSRTVSMYSYGIRTRVITYTYDGVSNEIIRDMPCDNDGKFHGQDGTITWIHGKRNGYEEHKYPRKNVHVEYKDGQVHGDYIVSDDDNNVYYHARYDKGRVVEILVGDDSFIFRFALWGKQMMALYDFCADRYVVSSDQLRNIVKPVSNVSETPTFWLYYLESNMSLGPDDEYVLVKTDQPYVKKLVRREEAGNDYERYWTHQNEYLGIKTDYHETEVEREVHKKFGNEGYAFGSHRGVIYYDQFNNIHIILEDDGAFDRMISHHLRYHVMKYFNQL